VQRYFALEEEVRTLHEEVAGRVSIASIYSIGLSHMNRFVQRFLRDFPKANVRVQYQHPRRVYELVESDQVDLGLVSYPRSSRTIKATVWREEPMVVVCAPSHPLAQRDRAALEDLRGLDMIGFDSDLEIRHEIDRALAAHGVEVHVAMEFDNTETIKRAVEINAGISLLPEPTIDHEVSAGALAARPLIGIDLKRPIGIVQRRGKELGKTARRFMQLLLKQSSSSRDAARHGSPAEKQRAAEDDAAELTALTDDTDDSLRQAQAAAAAQMVS
jgi:DNA-binding transcriptional LysR family regulator